MCAGSQYSKKVLHLRRAVLKTQASRLGLRPHRLAWVLSTACLKCKTSTNVVPIPRLLIFSLDILNACFLDCWPYNVFKSELCCTWGREQREARSQAATTITRVLWCLERWERGHTTADSLHNILGLVMLNVMDVEECVRLSVIVGNEIWKYYYY